MYANVNWICGFGMGGIKGQLNNFMNGQKKTALKIKRSPFATILTMETNTIILTDWKRLIALQQMIFMKWAMVMLSSTAQVEYWKNKEQCHEKAA